MGIRDRPISPHSPWQNAYAERLIGTLRRDCLDHVLIFGERHLRRTLTAYFSYYNETRTHLSLDKDAPISRAVQRCEDYSRYAHSVWAASSLRADIVFGRDRLTWLDVSPSQNAKRAASFRQRLEASNEQNRRDRDL
jgi:hypothetical protein